MKEREKKNYNRSGFLGWKNNRIHHTQTVKNFKDSATVQMTTTLPIVFYQQVTLPTEMKDQRNEYKGYE